MIRRVADIDLATAELLPERDFRPEDDETLFLPCLLSLGGGTPEEDLIVIDPLLSLW